MPAGIQLKDQNNKVILDVSDNPLVLQRSVITTSGVAGSFTLAPGPQGIWWQVSQINQGQYDRPNVTQNGNTVSWSAAPAQVKITGGAK